MLLTQSLSKEKKLIQDFQTQFGTNWENHRDAKQQTEYWLVETLSGVWKQMHCEHVLLTFVLFLTARLVSLNMLSH